jgi:phenylpropionate dioxygenase-like ring-hydroxylating dioxygenase large terminal subunit
MWMRFMAIFFDNPALANCWLPAATETEIGRSPVARTVLGRRIVLYRDRRGAVIVAPDRCPHREAPLSAGVVDGGVLTCPYHGWSFGEDGRCVRIPSAPADVAPAANCHLERIPAVERYGLVWVSFGTGPAELPLIRQERDPAFRRINNPIEEWRVSATRMVDNFLDYSHFPWVHRGSFGSSQPTEVPLIRLETLDDGYYGYEYEVIASNPPEAQLISGQAGDRVGRHMTTGFHLPFAVRSTIAYQSGLRHVLLLLSTPIDDVTSYFTFVAWRNDDFSVSAEDVIAFDRMIGAEDKAMLERIPGVLPLSLRALASTQSDRPSIAWRQQFARLLGETRDPLGALAEAAGG